MPLTQAQKKYLRGLAHSKKPVVMIGQNGIGPGVIQELDGALTAHELIKVSVRVGDRDARNELLAELVKQCNGELVQRIGNVAALYRRHKDKPRIVLPDG